MSRFDFKLPDIGEGVMEGEIVKWLVAPGDAVDEDQPMVEVMTDKATVTITSPKSGKVVSLGGAEGALIPVHATLIVLELSNGVEAAPPAAQKPKRDDGPAATAVGDIKETLPGVGLARSRVAPAASPPAVSAPVAAPVKPAASYFNERPLATPATRKLARELGVDLRAVAPTGPHGRVVKDDVRRSIALPATAQAQAPAGRSETPIAVRAPDDQADLEVRTPLRGVRKRIFDAMARSKHTAAHFTFVEECDVSRLKDVRDRLKPAVAAQGAKLSYLPLIIKAVVAALKAHPSLNAAFDESSGEIVERRYYNIGIASATEAGLMVPVVKNADKLGLVALAKEIERLSEATKSGRVAPADLQGSTFTITSLGREGGLFATPILNLPEVGILGIHRIKQQPVVRDDQIVIGEVMLVSLSFDHRLIDGHVGAAFAYEIIRFLEEPALLLLDP